MSNEKKPYHQQQDTHKNRGQLSNYTNLYGNRTDATIEYSRYGPKSDGIIEKGFRKDKKK